MIALAGSGGGFVINALGLASVLACKKLKVTPNLYMGTSATAYTYAIAAVKGLDYLHDALYKLDIKDAYPKGFPFDKKGKRTLRSYFNLIIKGYATVQHGSRVLKQHISKKEWEAHCEDPNSPTCYVCTVQATTGEPVYWNLKQIKDRDYAFKVIEASARIPVMTQSINLGTAESPNWHWDGGNREHNAGAYLLKNYGKHIDTFISVWSRPKDCKHYNSNHSKDFLTTTSRVLEIYNIGTTKDDELEQRKWLDTHKHIKSYFIFLDRFLKNPYDYYGNKTAIWEHVAQKAVNDQVKINY